MTTPFQQLANYVQTTLASGCTAGATTISVVSAAGFPTAGNFMLRVDDVAPATTFELMECTGVSGTTLTVTRGQESTTGIAHNAGAFVGNDITAGMLGRAFPWGVLTGGYAQTTTLSQTGIVAATDVTGLTATVTVGSNRKIRIRAQCTVQPTVATDTWQLTINEGVTVLAEFQGNYNNTANQVLPPFEVTLIAPTAGSHTYKVQALRAGGTGTVTANSGATFPAFICVEDIGPA